MIELQGGEISVASQPDIGTTFYFNLPLIETDKKSIVEKTGEMAPNEVRDILQASNAQTTGIFDTHLSNSQRIQKARDAQSVGVFHCTAPAGILFSNFEMTCKGVTDDFYRNVFGVSKQAIRKRRRRG